MADRAAELAYIEAVRTITAQQASVESAYSRIGQVFSVTAIGTGFLGPAALEGHTGMPRLGWLAIALLLVVAVASVRVWWPRNWAWTNEARQLGGEAWVGRTDDEVNRLIAGYMSGHAESNQKRLDAQFLALRVAIAASAGSLIAWTSLLGGVFS